MRKIISDKEGHYVLLKMSIIQVDITILNIYAPNNRASNFMRQKLTELQRDINESTISWRLQQQPLSEMDRSSQQKISKDITELNSQ